MTVSRFLKILGIVLIAYHLFDALGIRTVNYLKNHDEIAANFHKFSFDVLLAVIESLIIFLFIFFANGKQAKTLVIDPWTKIWAVIIGVFLSVSILKNLADLSLLIAVHLHWVKGVALNMPAYSISFVFLLAAVLSVRFFAGSLFASPKESLTYPIDTPCTMALTVGISCALLKVPFTVAYFRGFLHHPLEMLMNDKANYAFWGVLGAIAFTRLFAKVVPYDRIDHTALSGHRFSIVVLTVCYSLVFPHYYAYAADVIYGSIVHYFFHHTVSYGLFKFTPFRAYHLFLGVAFTLATIFLFQIFTKKRLKRD